MASLPETPVNTALTIGAVVGMALIGYTQTLRTKTERQVHDNYRAFKAMDTEVQAGPVMTMPLLEKQADRHS